MVSDKLHQRYYPDGFRNGTLAFYGWVREYSSPEITLLNLGAGITALASEVEHAHLYFRA